MKRYLNKKALFEKTSLSDSTIRRLELQGLFPKRIRVLGRVLWIDEEIDQAMDALREGDKKTKWDSFHVELAEK